MTANEHSYTARLVWSGNGTEGTADYESYSRRYRVIIAGKPELEGSADAVFRGDVDRHNPEDLFVTAISACHMLVYLALCARGGVRVLSYEDSARGTMRIMPGGGGRFEEVVLTPAVTVSRTEQSALAMRLHEAAHARCFIANSCSVPIRCDAAVHVV
jgi:organic hydroperoxide reductase OsmC/OhrA